MISFSQLLQTAGLPLADVRLLRHADKRHPGKPSPYGMWRDRRDLFEAYQSTQSPQNAAALRAPFWAAFVATPDDRTIFAGLYRASHQGVLAPERVHPELSWLETTGVDDEYALTLDTRLSEYIGRLYVDWGKGLRTWIQRADRQNKSVVELTRTFSEPEFPGFTKLITTLSQIETLPRMWRVLLTETRGVYVLTCPRTREQYVGIAHGGDGFLGRWTEYARTGHGGNEGLKSRDPSDYQVAILETVGSSSTIAELEALEVLWKRKLQSREMGLNRN